MDYLGLTPMLICRDVQASIAFYEQALGLHVEGRDDAVGHSGWASLHSDDEHGRVHLMLASPTYLPKVVRVQGRYPQVQHYFYVRGLEELRARIVAAGHEPSAIEQRFYGQREFELVDPGDSDR